MKTERIYVRNVRNPMMKTVELVEEQITAIVGSELMDALDGLRADLQRREEGTGGVIFDHNIHRDIAIMRDRIRCYSLVLSDYGYNVGETY